MLKILFLADTHLGFDMPQRPKVERRRRGSDFFDNFMLALEPAFRRRVDLVVHGGDLLYRSRVPDSLVVKVFEPLIRLAETGMPVFIVPGNHERSKIPVSIFESHENIRIFNRPRTYTFTGNGIKLALSGFPFVRNNSGSSFPKMVKKTAWSGTDSDIRILCMHQIVEGAVVGPSGYTFREGPDVIGLSDLPACFDLVLSGHIHRCQSLLSDTPDRPLKAPVLYPGSIERTSFAERGEKKGYLVITVEQQKKRSGCKVDWSFVELPARPMVRISIDPAACSAGELLRQFSTLISDLHPDSVVKVVVKGQVTHELRPFLTTANFRALAPSSMNIDLVIRRFDQA